MNVAHAAHAGGPKIYNPDDPHTLKQVSRFAALIQNYLISTYPTPYGTLTMLRMGGGAYTACAQRIATTHLLQRHLSTMIFRR